MAIPNENNVKGKWLEIKGEVQKSWGKLTDDDLEKTKGDIKAISGLIQQKYGDVQKEYDEKLNGIFHKYEVQKNDTLDNVKKSLK